MYVYLFLCIPIVIVLKCDIPNSAAVLHERSRHVADSLNSLNVSAFQISIDVVLVYTGKEGVETVFVGCLVSRTQPNVADRTDVVAEIGNRVVTIRRLYIRYVTSRERISNLRSTYFVGNTYTATLIVGKNLSDSSL